MFNVEKKNIIYTIILQLFWNKIYVTSKNDGVDLMKTVQFFDFHFISSCLKEFLKS